MKSQIDLNESLSLGCNMTSENMNPGKVFIASINLRGKRAEKPPGSVSLNVTSAQRKNSQERVDFSPMQPNGYKGFLNFEAYWQSGKVWGGVPRKESVDWWKKQKEPKRRFPKGKGRHVLHAIFEGVEGVGGDEKLDYVCSRKLVYVPEYAVYISNTESLHKWKNIVKSGQDVVIYDFDGVRKPDGDVDIKEVTLDLLKEKINDVRHPFGHGFVIASLLSGIEIEDFVK